jgi:HrpA-like RNA helicase
LFAVSYFAGFISASSEAVSVGTTRFPLDIKYPTDLTPPINEFIVRAAEELEELTSASRISMNEVVKAQYHLTILLVREMVKRGTGVLIFVAGMYDIVELAERFEKMPGFKVCAIHSDIPYEEQEAAFLPVRHDEVKVILATNAAESSITLPDVDVVVCLGSRKILEYDHSTQRSRVAKSWISKASATQRAGRTGRLRRGTVFRLYSDVLYDSFEEYDASEITQTPLHGIILSLRHMLESSENFSGVTPVLESLLEPPDVTHIAKSFELLHQERFITEPKDCGELTIAGDLVAQLSLDCQLGKLIVFGIRLGCATECVIMAAALMQPMKLFRTPSPIIHKDPDEFNEIVRVSTIGAFDLDSGLCSEPMM